MGTGLVITIVSDFDLLAVLLFGPAFGGSCRFFTQVLIPTTNLAASLRTSNLGITNFSFHTGLSFPVVLS